MTEQDYIETLPLDTQEYIKHFRETVKSNLKLCCYIMVDEHIIETDMFVACFWQSRNPETIVVDKTFIGDYEVSTVFLSVGSSSYRKPVMHFETMVFSPQDAVIEKRYPTLQEAREGHYKICEEVRNGKIKSRTD